ncbi:MAG: lysophospholipid acyltransferase family protein [Mucilaginibacter polytrichastri]|nr:lysophospholipid acyltransferase family protein [Mucilaginibacter polytrichastri]
MGKAFSRLGTVFLYLVSLLPFPVLYVISDLVYLLLFYVIRYRREVTQSNLRSAFPEKSDAERHRIERLFYRHFSDQLLEGIKLFSISAKDVLRRFHVLNPEVCEQYYAQGKSIVGVVGHYGNWELGALAGTLITTRKNLIVYKPLHNAVFDKAFFDMRSRFGGVPVPMASTLRAVVKYRSEPTLIIFAGDQTPVREQTQLFIPFLNQPTAVFLGAEKIAQSTGSPVVFIDVRKVRRGFYTCRFVPLVENPGTTGNHEITKKYMGYLEQVIRSEPQYWLWSHRRWKFKPEGIPA